MRLYHRLWAMRTTAPLAWTERAGTVTLSTLVIASKIIPITTSLSSLRSWSLIQSCLQRIFRKSHSTIMLPSCNSRPARGSSPLKVLQRPVKPTIKLRLATLQTFEKRTVTLCPIAPNRENAKTRCISLRCHPSVSLAITSSPRIWRKSTSSSLCLWWITVYTSRSQNRCTLAEIWSHLGRALLAKTVIDWTKRFISRIPSLCSESCPHRAQETEWGGWHSHQHPLQW